MLLLLLAVAPHKRALAQAVDAYHSALRDVRPELTLLLEQRPWDDDVAFWLARAELDAGHCSKAALLLSARDGVAVPSDEFRAWESQSWACVGRLDRALEQGKQVQELEPRSKIYGAHHALMGLLWLEQGDPALAAAELHLAGGDPDVWLSAQVRAQVPARVLGVAMLQVRGGELLLRGLSRGWTLEIQSGLLREQAVVASEREPAAWAAHPEAPRSLGRGCGTGALWSSPREPLEHGAAGIFVERGGAVETLVRARPGEQLEAPVCYQGELAYMLRRPGAQGIETLLVVAGQERAQPSPPVGFDWGAGGLAVELLDGRVLLDGEQLFESPLALGGARWPP